MNSPLHFHILSPSGKIEPQYIDGATRRLEDWGFTVSEGVYARTSFGRFAGTCEQRLEDLKAALQDNSIDYILCARGGYGLQQIIDRIAPFTLHRPLPAIIGFSDITCLHNLMALRGVPSLHGLMCKHLAEPEGGETCLRYWRQAVTKQPVEYSIPAHPLNRTGMAEGILVGGNLSVLYGLQGTPYALAEILRRNNEKGVKTLLFIEDIAERHYHIDRMMQNLRLSGVLAGISGLVVGQFSDCEDDPSMQETVYDTILSAVKGYDYPVLFDFPAGHVPYNVPFWLGTRTQISVSAHQSDPAPQSVSVPQDRLASLFRQF